METYSTMFGLLALFLIISAVIGYRDRQRKDRIERQTLQEAFGKPGCKEYPDGRLAQIQASADRHSAPFTIDAITWNDLDLDLLYQKMDTTCSGAGEEYLYGLLRAPRIDGGSSCSEEGLVWWAAHDKERIDVQRILQTLGRSSKYSIYDYLDLIDDLPDRRIAQDLPALALPAISLLVMAIRPAAGLLCLLASLVYNMVTYFRVKREIEPYLFTFRYVLRLLECGRKLSDAPFLHYEEEKETMRAAYASMRGFARGSSLLLRGGAGMTSGSPLDLLLDYLCILFHIDLMKFGSMLRQLRGRQDDIHALIRAVGSIDAQISIASFRESLPVYCVPDLTGSHFEVRDLVHPLIHDPVPNSMDTSRPVLLTGSNASGKSTFLKAAALAALLAQSVHTVPAAAYKSCCYRIYTSMALRDDIRTGESYFIVEIRSLKRVLDAADETAAVPVLCCVDEVLRGTNTIERISASAEILRSLSQKPIQVFAATHDMELTGLLKAQYTNYHFTETLDGDDVTFSYRLQEGPADSRNAIRLLRALGYDKDIADSAEARARRFEETGIWTL